jgi:uncharacterized membrane protein
LGTIDDKIVVLKGKLRDKSREERTTMTTTDNTTPPNELVDAEETNVNPRLNRAIFLCSLIGMIIAALLWKWHLNPVDIPCGTSHGCQDVAISPYSRLPVGTGPPIAMWGTIGYLGLAFLAFIRTLDIAKSYTYLIRLGLLIAGIIGLAMSLRLTYLEFFVIHAICKWCIGSQILMIIVFFLILIDFFSKSKSKSSQKSLSFKEYSE